MRGIVGAHGLASGAPGQPIGPTSPVVSMGSPFNSLARRPTRNQSRRAELVYRSRGAALRDPHGYIDGGPIPGKGYEANLGNQASYLSVLLRALPAFRNAWPTTNSNLSAIVGFGKRYHDHKMLSLPDPCAPAVGTYKRDYGPSGSISEGFADCIPGNGRFPSLDGSNIANRVSSFLTQFYEYVDRRLP
jgi:hypothetical protein